MSCSRSSRSVLVLALALLAACGKQGPPQPPLRSVPAPTRDLAVAQQGQRLLFSFTYPKLTPAGMALEGISSVEIWEAARPLPASPPPAAPTPPTTPPAEGTPAPTAPATPAAPAASRVAPLDAREFNAAATLSRTIPQQDLSQVTFGDRIVFDLPLPEPLPDPPQARYFAVRTVSTTGERSELSNQVALVPKTAPDSPERITVTPRSDGVLVEWPAVEGAQGYNIYRRDAEERSHRQPVQSVAAEERSWLDTSARYGKSYIYAVTSLAQRDPIIESAITTEREVRYQDRFAPPPPVELVALAESGRVRLVWRASEVGDLAGYLVYRRGPVGDFVRVTTNPVKDAEYIDTTVAAGETYSYRVTAVDQTGNESDPGAEVRATVP